MYELKTRAKFFENGAPVLIFSTISTTNQDFKGKKRIHFEVRKPYITSIALLVAS